MAGNDLMMSLRLQLAEKVSGPLKNITQASQINAKALRANRDQLRALERQSGLIQRLKQQQEAFKRASNEMRVNQANLNALKLSGSATAAQIKAQTALVDKSTLAFTRQKDRLFELRSAVTAAGIGKLSDDEKRLADSIGRTTQQIQQQESALKRLDQLREQRNRALAITAGIGGAGLALRMAGNKGLSTARNAMMPGFEFDSAMAQVQGRMGLSNDSGDLKALRAAALGMWKDSGTEVAAMQLQLAQLRYSTDQIITTMPHVKTMSDASGKSLSETAELMGGLMKGFDIDAADFAHVSDVLIAASSNSKISFDALHGALVDFAPTAKTIGMSIEETAAMIAMMGNAGVEASDATRVLNSTFKNLQNPSDATRKMLASMGISARDAQGNLRTIPDLLVEIDKRTAGMNDMHRNEVLGRIFDPKSVPGMVAIMQQMRGGGMAEMVGTLQNSGGATMQAAANMTNHLGNKVGDLRHGLSSLGAEIFELNKDWLKDFVISITNVIGSIRTWIKENPQLVATLSKFFMIGSAIMAVVGTLMVAFAAIAAPIIMFKFAILGLTVKGGGLIGMLKGLFTLLRAHPFGLLITAIAFAAGAIFANWDAIVWFFKDTWDNIKTFFSSGIGNITATILNWSPLNLFYQAFAAVLSWFGIDLPEDFGTAAVNVITGFGEGVLGMASWLWDTVTGVFSGVFDWFTDMPARFMEMGGQVIEGLVDGIKGAAGAVKDAVVNTANNVVGWFKGILGIRSPSRVFMDAGLNISEGAAIGISNGLPRVKRATEALGNEALPRFRADTRSPIGSIAAAAAARSTPITYGGDQITINIIGTGLNAQEVAQAVDAKLRQRDQAKAASRRSSYYD